MDNTVTDVDASIERVNMECVTYGDAYIVTYTYNLCAISK